MLSPSLVVAIKMRGVRPSDLLGVIRNSLCSPFDRGRISVETLKKQTFTPFIELKCKLKHSLSRRIEIKKNQWITNTSELVGGENCGEGGKEVLSSLRWALEERSAV